MGKQLIVLILALPMHLCYGATITLKEIVPFSSNRSFPMAPSAGISPPPAVLKWDPEQALHFEAKVNPDFEPSQRATGSGTWMSPIMCPEFSYAEGFQTVLDITDLTVPSREDSFFVTDLKLHCSGQPETQVLKRFSFYSLI